MPREEPVMMADFPVRSNRLMGILLGLSGLSAPILGEAAAGG
jgi:hypothetical protein